MHQYVFILPDECLQEGNVSQIEFEQQECQKDIHQEEIQRRSLLGIPPSSPIRDNYTDPESYKLDIFSTHRISQVAALVHRPISNTVTPLLLAIDSRELAIIALLR